MRRVSRFLNMANIKVIGVGGGGCNAINRMVTDGIYGVDFMAINTDKRALADTQATSQLLIGERLTGGSSTGGNVALGEQAALDALPEIEDALRNIDMVFITAGMGGGTGTGAAPVIAKAAQKLGVLTIAIVTEPFMFEGRRNKALADAGIARLEETVDTLIVIPNDRLLSLVNASTSLTDAFSYADQVLRDSIQAISELITMPGLINLDFADVRSVMSGQGRSVIAQGLASGENRAEEAAQQATVCPLLDKDIAGAQNVIVNITAGTDWNIWEMERVSERVRELADPHAHLYVGMAIDDRMGDSVRVTVIATGFAQAVSERVLPLPLVESVAERPLNPAPAFLRRTSIPQPTTHTPEKESWHEPIRRRLSLEQMVPAYLAA